MTDLRTLSRNATPGIWIAVGSMVETASDKHADPACCGADVYDQGHLQHDGAANALFIAALVNAYRAGLLVEV